MKKAVVTFYSVEEQLPPYGAMIIADTGQEYHILMSEGGAIAAGWEDEEYIAFQSWAHLGDLSKREELIAQ